MKRATITEAKNGLSALIDQVRAGESIVILDRGLPVARLEPIVTHPDQTGRLGRLERAGVLRVSSAPPPIELIGEPPPRPKGAASAVDALIDERRTGR
jgi:prevent-host-death family protein